VNIYTRTGDDGMTGLFGGRRVSKADARIEAYGTVDELNAFLGVARAANTMTELGERIESIQNDLFILGADLATPMDMNKVSVLRIEARHITAVEHAIDEIEELLPPIRFFILPGGCSVAAMLHACRTICRRAERAMVHLSTLEEMNELTLQYINRLSDYLFVLARYSNRLAGLEDVRWNKEE